MKNENRRRWASVTAGLLVGLLIFGAVGFAGAGGGRGFFGLGVGGTANEALADRLGISVEELDQALQEARQQMVMNNPAYQALADKLGITVEELTQAMQEAQQEAMVAALTESDFIIALAEKLSLTAEELAVAFVEVRGETTGFGFGGFGFGKGRGGHHRFGGFGFRGFR